MKRFQRVIFLDLDGVFVDLDTVILSHGCKLWTDEIWQVLDKVDNLFLNAPKLPGSEQILQAAKLLSNSVAFLTAIPQPTGKLITASADKVQWVRSNLCRQTPVICAPTHIVRAAQSKLDFMVPGDVIVDDALKNIVAWEKAGGIGIHHKGDVEETVRKMFEVLG